LLLVTHDRYFLDRVCNRILELDRGVLYTYQGNYGYFVEKKAMREEVEASEREKNRNTFRRELEWVRRMPKARTTKSKSRVDAFDDLAEKVKGPYTQQKVEFGVNQRRFQFLINQLEWHIRFYLQMAPSFFLQLMRRQEVLVARIFGT